MGGGGRGGLSLTDTTSFARRFFEGVFHILVYNRPIGQRRRETKGCHSSFIFHRVHNSTAVIRPSSISIISFFIFHGVHNSTAVVCPLYSMGYITVQLSFVLFFHGVHNSTDVIHPLYSKEYITV
jgi:hypothetical protein